MDIPDTSSLYKSPEGHAAMMQWYDSELERLQRTVSVDCEFINTRFGPTHVVSAGAPDAPPLALITGLGGSSLTWFHQIVEFSRFFRVYAPDTVGQPGRSAPTRPSQAGPAYSLWLLDLFDELSIERGAIIGASLGGRMVIKFGGLAPERITRAVLVSSMGFKALSLGLFLRLAPMAFGGGRLTREQMLALMSGVMFPSISIQSSDMQSFLEGLCLFGEHYRQETWSGVPMTLPLPSAELRRYAPLTLALFGEHEALFDPRAAQTRALHLLPNLVAAEIVPGVGHCMHYERPEVVNSRILAFLQSSTG